MLNALLGGALFAVIAIVFTAVFGDTSPDYGYTHYTVQRGSTVRTTRPITFRDGVTLPAGTIELVRQTGVRCVVDFAQFTRRVDRDALAVVQPGDA